MRTFRSNAISVAMGHLRRWCNVTELVLGSALALGVLRHDLVHVGHAISAISGWALCILPARFGCHLQAASGTRAVIAEMALGKRHQQQWRPRAALRADAERQAGTGRR